MSGFQAGFRADGGMEIVEESKDTDLGEHGVDVPAKERDQESKIEQEQASEFGVDDRSTDTSSRDESEQANLFPDVDDDDQMTLTGSRASTRCLWGEDA